MHASQPDRLRKPTSQSSISRRRLLEAGFSTAVTVAMAPTLVHSHSTPSPLRRIPSTGEEIPAIGLGTWITFNVGSDPVLRRECAAVMAAFFEAGGGLIDSSPMYGSSQPVVGFGLDQLGHPASLFSADKVWISSGADGPDQIERSRQHWGVPRFDLLQVHNLLAWREHLATLFEMKAAGRLRYVGITTSHGRRHDDLEEIMSMQPLDFVQLTYNIVDREADARLLPLANDRGIGVIVNRPFQQGALVRRLRSRPLPAWAPEIGANTWPQFILKYILSHPAVTTVIPATTRVEHVRENKAVAEEALPDQATRIRMAAYVREL